MTGFGELSLLRKKLVRFLIPLVIVVILPSFASCTKERSQKADARKEIAKYMKLLEAEPENCFYLEQVATWNQMIYQLDKAIEYYQKTLTFCPENAMARFDLGVTHFINKNYELGLENMDAALSMARESGDEDLILMFKTDKQALLDNWDKVKELELNK